MPGTQSLPSVTYSSIHSTPDSVVYPDPTIFPSPSRHVPIPDVLPLDSSSLLYPCSSIGDPTASWSHKDIHGSELVPGLYNTPSPPNFHMDIGYSTSNSNYSQNSTKIDTSSQLSEHVHCGPMHPSYFYPPTGPSQETDLWNVTPPRSLGPISSHYTSQDPLKPLPIPSPPSYISPHITYPSPDSTSTHPFYTSSLFQHPGVRLDETILSQSMLPDLIDTLPAVPLGELTHNTRSVHQEMSLCPLISPPVLDSNSKTCLSNSPTKSEVLNESPHSTHSYPLTLETSQPIPTDTSGYYLSDLPHPYSNALDDTVFSTASFPLSS
eukprot:TRINITY_DN6206_c0_g1_i1.p1 TRINITY_DN6206_c0_g1~~TRINITY_DN6206_c0_g1_i1.p1  ORF type:complete len:354 (+),score=88.07 TRINITY_DN6206_c0_g1_i1:94-1062(+)